MAPDPALPRTLLSWMVRGEWRAHPVRTLVAVLAIAVGVALGFAVHLVNRSALAEFDTALRSVSGSADLRVEAVSPAGFDEALYPRIARLPVLSAASPVVEVEARTADGRPLTVLGLDPLRAARVTPALAAGAGPAFGAGGGAGREDAAWLSPALAEGAGATLEVREGGRRVVLPVAGGLVSGGTRRGDSRLLLDGAVFDNGGVGVVLDAAAPVRVVVSQGCRPIGDPMTVTASTGMTVSELAGRPALERLRDVVPKWVTLASRLAVLPGPDRPFIRFDPWGRLEVYRRDYESLIDALIDRARRDPGLDERTDILALFLRSRYDDGSAMTRGEIGDELLTLLAAGHETTASTLAWVFERISRHPDVLASLSAEAAGEESSYRQATILETQRVRTVIDFASRHVAVPVYELGPWRIPRGYTIMVNLHQLHHNPVEFPDPEKFEPRRFIDAKPNTFSWVPFGGGTRRCVGAAFANLEMDVVLRTVLRTMTIQATDEPDEKPHNRGVAFTPKRGGRVTVHRRGGHV